MAFRTSVTIVASPRPRVGTTLLARLLTDFQTHEGRAVAAFDLGEGPGRLARFLPERVAPASIGDVKGQMALFDTLVGDDDAGKIVDLGAASFESFFTLAEQIGFVEEARSRGVATAAMVILTPDRASVEALHGLRRRFPRLRLAPVHNEMFGPAYQRDRYPLAADDVVMRLPMLAAAVRKYAETPPFSFASAASTADMPLDAHIALQRWLRRIYLQFRELDLRLLLTDLRAAIGLGR